jgi:hypothetical protein
MGAPKSQDVAVVLQVCRYRPPRPSYATIAATLSMSASEVHAAVKRAQASQLVHGPELGDRPNLSEVEGFLAHGLRYAFPAERGAMTRGVATSYAAEPLRSMIAAGDEPVPVWRYAEGPQRGIAFEPLYAQAPQAALRDPELYELLALADALREGRARERKLAADLLIGRLRKAARA